MAERALLRRAALPPVLLGRFADGAGQVMAERRDRGRRLLVPVSQAAANAGAFALSSGGTVAALDRLLAEMDARAGRAIDGVLAGAFPPAPGDRAALALLLALQLLVGRGHRERAIRAAALLGQVIAGNLPDAEDTEETEEEEEEEAEDPEAADEPDEATEEESEESPETEAAAADDTESEDEQVEISVLDTPLDLTPVPELARLLVARTWQLVRFPSPVLLTGDTPAVLWTRPGAPTAHRWGLGGAEEVRVPLDPRHALIVARHAPAGEVVRELDERHARALNRTVAEATHLWMYYHPGSDPLERVELAPS
jgi:Protein of unknown function (DUF4238)